LAADIKSADIAGNVITEKEEVYRNLYTAGGSVDLKGEVKGDLVSVGGNININGNVERSVLIAGGNVTINSEIGNSVRIAGGNVFINGKIKEDLVIFGGSVKVNKDAEIEGDLLCCGGQITVDGKVKGKAIMSGEEVSINGEIGSNVRIDSVLKLVLGDSAVVKGDLEYSSRAEGIISENAKIEGNRKFNKLEQDYNFWGYNTSMILVFALVRWVALLAFMLLIVYLAPKQTLEFTNKSLAGSFGSILWGIGSLVAIPIISLILFSTLIGFPIGIVTMLTYFAMMFIASPLAGIMIGSLLNKQIYKSESYKVNSKILLTGSLITIALSLIPVFGWIIIFAFFLIAFGGLTRSLVTLAQGEQKV
jgi:cytoskeletal protein CcmA (bactofilin family)